MQAHPRAHSLSATPISPGRIYHVKGAGLDLHILAENGAHAIVQALGLLEGGVQ